MNVYLDGRSPIHAFDPRVKIAWSLAVSLLAVILRHPAFLAGLFLLTILPWLLVRPPLSRLRVLLIVVAMTVVGNMITQGLFYGFEPRTEVVTIVPGLSVCREGLIYGAIVSLRLLAVLSAGMLVVLTTHPSDMILALTRLRVPQWFAFMLTLSLRFLPETIEQGRRIMVAQQLRGAGGRGAASLARRFRFLIVPLLTTSLRSARQVALAAEVRAYCSQRVPSKDLQFNGTDWAALVILALLTAAGFVTSLLGYGPTAGGIL